MRTDRSFLASTALSVLLVFALGCNKDDDNNNNNGTVTTTNTPNFECLTHGVNCYTTGNIDPTFFTSGSSANFSSGICACGQIGQELVAYVQNGVTRYSCVNSNTVVAPNGAFILSWSFSSRNGRARRGRRATRTRRAPPRRRGRIRGRSRRARSNVNVIFNTGSNNHGFYQSNSGLCQQSIAQACRRHRACRRYIHPTTGQRAYCSNGNNTSIRGYCVF